MASMVLTAWCQGTVNFANGAADVNAPVTIFPGPTLVEGPDWQAELWMANTNGNWLRIGLPVPFLTNAVAGYFLGGLVTVPGVEPGQQATFRVRAFNTKSALESISRPVTVNLGGAKMPPTNLLGLESWSITGRPQLTIALLANDAAISWPTEFANFALESSDSLTLTNWSLVNLTKATNGTQISVTAPIGPVAKYFRLRSN